MKNERSQAKKQSSTKLMMPAKCVGFKQRTLKSKQINTEKQNYTGSLKRHPSEKRNNAKIKKSNTQHLPEDALTIEEINDLNKGD